MSQFLPESLTPTDPATAVQQGSVGPVTQADRTLASRILRPELLSEDLLAYIVDYLAVNQPPIPLSLIQGYQQQAWQDALVTTEEHLTSTSYANLATTGPTLSGLGDGTYVITFGCTCKNLTTGIATLMSIQVNSTTAVDNDSCQLESDVTGRYISIARSIKKTATNSGNNTITAKYRTGPTGDAYFKNRWMIVQRIGDA